MKALFDAIAHHARERPDVAALVHAGTCTHSWSHLHGAIQRRAAALRAAGVGPNGRVLLLRAASPEWVVDALATWWAGAAIVPIDPALPWSRRQALARHADAGWRLGPTLGLGIPTAADGDGVPSPPDGAPDRLAWIVFSSGSTGSPKGVCVGRDAYTDVLAAQVDALALTSADRCTWLLSPGFDASLSDVGVALLSGATLHTEPPGLLRDPPRLRRVFQDRAITYADLPPRYLSLLDPDDLPHLRVVLCGGEPLPPAGARRWAHARRLIGVYGPTEATICSSLWRVDPTDVSRPHLGHPVAGARYRVVDDELWIGGPGLARGYLDPAHTQRRFVEADGQRWHRTGDRVRIDDDGAWLFAGRIDRQAKVDGRLVCPEELEAALRGLEGVTDARADVVERQGVSILEATVEADSRWTVPQLRAALARALPDWMLPRILSIGRLQRGQTGKTRRQDALTTVLSDVLDRSMAEEDSFAAAGLDSLRALDAAARLMARDIAVAPEQLRTADSLAALRSLLAPPTRSVRALVDRGRTLAWHGTASKRPGEHILLTGATGGLGARVLPRLLEGGHRVQALVRADSPAAARNRLAHALRHAGEAPTLAHHPRLQPIPGHLPDDALAGAAPSLVVHLAAAVDLSADLEALLATNVDATRQLVALAGLHGVPLLHASTLSVFVDTDAPRGLFSATDPLPDARICGGYGQSKLMAEALVQASAVRSCCIRYGLLVSEHVHTRPDWLGLTLRGLVMLGCVPQAALQRGLEVDLTPVGAAADQTVALAEQLLCGTAPPVAHVAAPRPASLSDVLQALQRAGVTIEPVDEQTFLDRTRSALSTARDPAASAALLGLVRGLRPDALGVHRSLDLFQATGCRFGPLPGIDPPSPERIDRVVGAALSRPSMPTEGTP